LDKGNQKKRERYLKQSKKTLKHCKQVCIDLASKGFLPMDKYIRLKGKQEKQKDLTLEMDIIVIELEECSDTNTLA